MLQVIINSILQGNLFGYCFNLPIQSQITNRIQKVSSQNLCTFNSNQGKAESSMYVREDAHFGGHYKHSQQACSPVQMTWFCLHATMK